MHNKRISEADLEEVFDDILGNSLPGEVDTSSILLVGATLLAAGVVFGIFTVGKRSGKLLSTVVEIKRS
tara:strand:+ start:78 stop:284 length:207 start_codon:yes stop_codon:yes gene_type:complete